MTGTERTPVRDRERTRRAILDAAEQAILQKGTKVSLSEIAALARVTKSGLMHHFPSRDDLIGALVEHTVERMWDEVRAHVDLSENRPGKLARAYVRALTGGSEYLTRAFSPSGLFATIGSLDAAGFGAQLEEDDARRWNEAFEADGLPPGRALVLRYAAEGLAAATDTPYLTAEQLAQAREELLALTEVDPG